MKYLLYNVATAHMSVLLIYPSIMVLRMCLTSLPPPSPDLLSVTELAVVSSTNYIIRQFNLSWLLPLKGNLIVLIPMLSFFHLILTTFTVCRTLHHPTTHHSSFSHHFTHHCVLGVYCHAMICALLLFTVVCTVIIGTEFLLIEIQYGV